MSANKFVLKHHEIEIDYTIGITPGLPALIYKDGVEEKAFKSSGITRQDTALGSLVSVPLLRTIDTGGENVRLLLAPNGRPVGTNGEILDGRSL